MSSILDALKKLEAEKAASQAAGPAVLDADIAEDELVGRRGNRRVRGFAAPLPPMAWAMAALAAAVALTAASAFTAVYWVQRQHDASSSIAGGPSAAAGPYVESAGDASAAPPQEDAGASAQEDAGASGAQEESPSAPANGIEQRRNITPIPPPRPEREVSVAATESGAAQASEPSSPASEPDPAPAHEPPPEPEPAPTPEPASVDEAPAAVRETAESVRATPDRDAPSRAAQEAPASSFSEESRDAPPRPPYQAPTNPRDYQHVDISSLPILTHAAREHYGLQELTVNLRRAPSPSRPEASAMINLNHIRVGETIPGTNAVLIGVSPGSIAIEVEGARYQVR